MNTGLGDGEINLKT